LGVVRVSRRYVSVYIALSSFFSLSHESPTTLPLVALILSIKNHTIILSQHISPPLSTACSSVRWLPSFLYQPNSIQRLHDSDCLSKRIRRWTIAKREMRSGCTEPYSSLVVHFLFIYPRSSARPLSGSHRSPCHSGLRVSGKVSQSLDHNGCTDTVDEEWAGAPGGGL